MPFFTTEKKSGATIIRFSFNELSLQDREVLKNEVFALLKEKGCFILNLSKIGFMSSMMAALIVAVVKQAAAQKSDVRLCELTDNAKTVFKITCLDQIFKIYGTEEDALKAA
ncbi:MAG TPA: STAS domain-containing protein [Candidatus Omnitrophota bacterium]|nr:STAS domain-containing protein [Candidatus Omnitrophota bacterium]